MSTEPQQPRRPIRPHASPTVRVLLLAVGSLCLVLALIGVFTPVLPTTPFVLLAAACYARGSPRVHRRLLASRWFGPLIVEWERYRSIPRRVKLLAIVMMASSLTISVVFFVEPVRLKGLLVAFGMLLAIWIYRIPSREAGRAATDRQGHP